MSDKEKRLCYDVINELWGFNDVPQEIQQLVEPNPKNMMLAIVKAYAQQQANEASKSRDKALDIDLVSDSFHKGYAEGWNDATKQATEEIHKNYRPNDR